MDPNKAHYVVATAIIIKDGKYLITKRSPKEMAFPNRWTVPGGKLELKDYKDKPKDTASHWYNVLENLLKREVIEETSLEIRNIRYLTSLTFIRPDDIPVLVLSFFADHKKGDVQLSQDLVDYAWVTLGQAKRYDLIEGIYEELEMLENKLKGIDAAWRQPKK